MTREQLERLKADNGNNTEFGAITTIDFWPVINLVYDMDGLPPKIYGQKQLLTVIEPEGEQPQLSGPPTPLGEVWMTSAEVEAIPGWKNVEKKIKEGLEEAWQRQQEAAGAPPAA